MHYFLNQRERLLLRGRCLRVLSLGLALAVILMGLPETTPVLAQAGPVQFQDVPSDHWAYKAVATLVEKGYLGLFQDGTFQGTKPVDRFTLATVIAKLLTDVQAGQVTLSDEDMKLLRKLSTEFREELVSLDGKTNALAADLGKANRNLVVLREDLTRVTGETYALRQDMAKVDGLKSDQGDLRQRLDRLEAEVKATSNRVTSLENQIGDVLAAQQTVNMLRQKGLEDRVSELQSEMTSYRRNTDQEMENLKSTNRLLLGGVVLAAVLAVIKAR